MSGSAPPGSGEKDEASDTVERLRAANDDLREERAWAEQQHRLWAQERLDLLDAMRRLRGENETLRASVRATAAPAAEPDAAGAEARAWYAQQKRAFDEERRNLLATIDELKAGAAAFEETRGWYEQQKREWDEERAALLSSVAQLQNTAAELDKARRWHEEQERNWQEEHRKTTTLLEEAKRWNEELEKTRSWYEEQQRGWVQERQSLLNIIEALKRSGPGPASGGAA